jgi:hypothetical protein
MKGSSCRVRGAADGAALDGPRHRTSQRESYRPAAYPTASERPSSSSCGSRGRERLDLRIFDHDRLALGPIEDPIERFPHPAR